MGRGVGGREERGVEEGKGREGNGIDEMREGQNTRQRHRRGGEVKWVMKCFISEMSGWIASIA